MVPPSDSRPGTHLPTGWRVVGPRAAHIVERATAAAVEHITPGGVADTLYALECTTDPVIQGRATVERVLDAVTEEVRETWPDCPRLLRDEEAERPPSRFGGLRYRFLADPGTDWVGEVVWRTVHPVVAGAPLTTRVLVEETGHYTRLSVRVTADDGPTSVRGYVGAGQAQPSFLRALQGELTPSWMGSPLAAHRIRPGDEEDFVLSVLEAPTRSLPVAVLSPLEEGGWVVDPEDLAWDLLGRARLYVLSRHEQTFALSDAVGDRTMSCYWGAARCYLPGWSRYDDPYEHPLLVRDRLADPVMRATWLGEVGVWTGKRTELPPSIDERRPTPVTEQTEGEGDEGGGGPEGPRGVTEEQGDPADRPVPATPAPGDEASTDDGPAAATEPSTVSDPAPILETLLGEVRTLGSRVDQLLRSNADLTDEVERLRTISAVRSSSTNAIERRLGRLEDILESVFPAGRDPTASDTAPGDGRQEDGVAAAPGAGPPADEDEGALRLVEIVREVSESHADALVLLDSAYDAAAESPYEDPERVRAILDAMARVARRRRDGALGTSLREAFADLGIDYRGAIARSTPERLRKQYRFTHPEGDLVEAEEHIVLGNTYDPRRCLRIYFSSRVPNEPRFVIGHVGRHFEVQSSS